MGAQNEYVSINSILVISMAFSQQISTYLACKLVSDDTDGGQCKAPFLSDFSHAYPDSQFVTSLTYVQTNMYLLVIFFLKRGKRPQYFIDSSNIKKYLHYNLSIRMC